jgi:SAM-dependent methyltransferase
MITLRNENCPICDSGNRRLLGKPGRISDAFMKYGEISEVNVMRCLDCSGKYIHPMMYFSEEFRKELYNLDYFNPHGPLEDFKNFGEKVTIMGEVKKRSGEPRGRTVLDIGCGTGEFLKAAADIGFNVTGIDVDTTTTEHITGKYGFRTVTGLLGPETFPAGSFDVVVLSHVNRTPAKTHRTAGGHSQHPEAEWPVCDVHSQLRFVGGRYSSNLRAFSSRPVPVLLLVAIP